MKNRIVTTLLLLPTCYHLFEDGVSSILIFPYLFCIFMERLATHQLNCQSTVAALYRQGVSEVLPKSLCKWRFENLLVPIQSPIYSNADHLFLGSRRWYLLKNMTSLPGIFLGCGIWVYLKPSCCMGR